MRNPWLDIPLEEYEGHMSLPSIGQARMLADQLDAVVRRVQPGSVAIIGCAGGNGLDRLDPGRVRRVVAVDINPVYVGEAARRHGSRFEHFAAHCADVESQALTFEPVDLVYAALLFEYVDIPAALETLKRLCRPGGMLVALLQLPHEEKAAISPSPFSSLRRLSPFMKLVDPADLARHAAAAGFTPVSAPEPIELSSGKRFLLQAFAAR